MSSTSFPSSFKLSNCREAFQLQRNFPTSLGFSNFAKLFPTLTETFQHKQKHSNFSFFPTAISNYTYPFMSMSKSTPRFSDWAWPCPCPRHVSRNFSWPCPCPRHGSLIFSWPCPCPRHVFPKTSCPCHVHDRGVDMDTGVHLVRDHVHLTLTLSLSYVHDFLIISITKISKLSPTKTVSNSRHQHQCSRLVSVRVSAWEFSDHKIREIV